MKNFASLLTTLILAISSSAHASLFGPSNFEECVLQGLKDAKTDYAAKFVEAMCLKKFPISDKSATSTLIGSKGGRLICDSKIRGFPPYQVSFDRTKEIFSVNGKTLKIHSQTKEKIYVTPDNGDIFLLNLKSGSLTLSNEKTEVVFDCEIAVR